MPTKAQIRRHLRNLAAWYESHNPATGAQTRGPAWRGLLPRRPHEVDWFAVPADVFEANKAIDERKPALGIMPASALAQLLAQLPRSDRRLLLATVQAAPTPRRARMQRQVHARLRARGLER